MDKIKYVGIDLHQSTCLIAVHDAQGKTKREEIVETDAEKLRGFFGSLDGSIHVAFEVGTQSAWLYEILKSLVATITVCDVREHKRRGNKSDRIDAHKLANWLRLGELKTVYQGDRNIRKLRDLAHGYLATVSDSIRVMNRIKALYRSWSIRCAGRDVYYKRNRENWLLKFVLLLRLLLLAHPTDSGLNVSSGLIPGSRLSFNPVPIMKWWLTVSFVNNTRTTLADLPEITIAFLKWFLKEQQSKQFAKTRLKLFTERKSVKGFAPRWQHFRLPENLQQSLLSFGSEVKNLVQEK
jgi:Transposase